MQELYDIIEEILEEDGKSETNIITMGDWNSVNGDKSYRNVLFHMNFEEEIIGQIPIDLCDRSRLVIANTWFKKPKRTL